MFGKHFTNTASQPASNTAPPPQRMSHERWRRMSLHCMVSLAVYVCLTLIYNVHIYTHANIISIRELTVKNLYSNASTSDKRDCWSLAGTTRVVNAAAAETMCGRCEVDGGVLILVYGYSQHCLSHAKKKSHFNAPRVSHHFRAVCKRGSAVDCRNRNALRPTPAVATNGWYNALCAGNGGGGGGYKTPLPLALLFESKHTYWQWWLLVML